jgi:hypothetical protein
MTYHAAIQIDQLPKDELALLIVLWNEFLSRVLILAIWGVNQPLVPKLPSTASGIISLRRPSYISTVGTSVSREALCIQNSGEYAPLEQSSRQNLVGSRHVQRIYCCPRNEDGTRA